MFEECSSSNAKNKVFRMPRTHSVRGQQKRSFCMRQTQLFDSVRGPQIKDLRGVYKKLIRLMVYINTQTKNKFILGGDWFK